jgi:molybdopterin-containing oxidoreductase family iron-sulfur binding subunit
MAQRKTKRYWKSLAERDAGAHYAEAPRPEFAEPLDLSRASVSRRGFLRAAGFTFAGAVLTGCQRAPVQKAIPFLVQPEEITPGRAVFYASTCGACSAACGLLVKNRDGRPIKLEGNPQHPLSRGGLCAAGQASLLGLYDGRRLKSPLRDGVASTWAAVDAAMGEQLAALKKSRGAVRFLSGTLHSPTAKAVVQRFLANFSDARQVVYDALSNSAILDAHELTHGVRVLPRYQFERAEVVVSFDADFLGTWISPVEYTAGYRQARQNAGAAQRPPFHAQFEARYSITGAKADRRVRVNPADMGLLMSHLAALVGERAGKQLVRAADLTACPAPTEVLRDVADRLWGARGRGLVVCGVQDVQQQVLCNYLNHALGNYGRVLDLESPSQQRQGSDAALADLLKELEAGSVAALFICDANPVFDLPNGTALAEAIKKVPLSVSFAQRMDETAAVTKFVCPDHHYLESWQDAEPVAGTYSICQPAIAPLGGTRALVESLTAWSGTPRSAYDLLREHWEKQVFGPGEPGGTFQEFWDRSVHDGVAVGATAKVAPRAFQEAGVRALAEAVRPVSGELALALYAKVGLGDGRHAYNAWLQELPDPITKATWDNYACLSPSAAQKLGVVAGDVVRIEASRAGQAALSLPVLVQPGQEDNTIAIALGYGSRETERFGNLGPRWFQRRPTLGPNGRIGANAAPLIQWAGDTLSYAGAGVRVTRTGARHELACTQDHHTITVPEQLAPAGGERRPIIQETAGVVLAAHTTPAARGPAAASKDLWPEDHPYTGHRWAMVMDLTACTGCSACVIACQVENNIPVVGKDEVRRNREMHWLRIDRYYSDDDGEVDAAFQPMMCQHCENAPCETVCPVLATVHSEEGLNQQVYNRCVGTRYCSNNCPYKVRRFNWFDYPHEDKLENLVLNPDVTVRTRGVMEKCSFCAQRIQWARLEARRLGRPLADGEVQTACQQSCPAGAVHFGDLNDPDSAVAKLVAGGRHYRVLEEINVRPRVGYLTLWRNRAEEKAKEAGHG